MNKEQKKDSYTCIINWNKDPKVYPDEAYQVIWVSNENGPVPMTRLDFLHNMVIDSVYLNSKKQIVLNIRKQEEKKQQLVSQDGYNVAILGQNDNLSGQRLVIDDEVSPPEVNTDVVEQEEEPKAQPAPNINTMSPRELRKQRRAAQKKKVKTVSVSDEVDSMYMKASKDEEKTNKNIDKALADSERFKIPQEEVEKENDVFAFKRQIIDQVDSQKKF